MLAFSIRRSAFVEKWPPTIGRSVEAKFEAVSIANEVGSSDLITTGSNQIMGAFVKSYLGDCSQIHFCFMSHLAPSKNSPLINAPSSGTVRSNPYLFA